MILRTQHYVNFSLLWTSNKYNSMILKNTAYCFHCASFGNGLVYNCVALSFFRTTPLGIQSFSREGNPEISELQRPDRLLDPNDSNAMNTHEFDEGKPECLTCLRTAAMSAAPPAWCLMHLEPEWLTTGSNHLINRIPVIYMFYEAKLIPKRSYFITLIDSWLLV